MPILSGDVKLLKSANMADVTEGGGAPTGNVIADGVSNAIFPDISELDRAGGRVSLRKTFVSVATDDTDTYFGGNVIVAEPPKDPRVSVTLFSNKQTFDTRTEAQTRVEAYLNKGPLWGGYLYENHIAGQRVIQLFQRETETLPTVGQTLVLVQNEGTATEKLQYVRATKVGSVVRSFYDAIARQDYKAAIVSVDISDALRYDFTGSPADRSFTKATAGALLRDTVVADAGTYVGVVPTTAAANIGDFTIKGASIYTQLVPSAQTETPIPEAKAYNLTDALLPEGSVTTLTESRVFTTTTKYYFGNPVNPGSITFSAGGTTVTDDAGVLFSAGSQVGTVDYENGIATLSTNVFGTGSITLSTTFRSAALVSRTPRSYGIKVTAANRSMSWVRTLNGTMTRKSMSVSYRTNGRWYVLRDTGGGQLKGSDASFGAGTVNYTTKTINVTLGALPDVGSSIIYNWIEDTNVGNANIELKYGSKAFIAFNSDGQEGTAKGSRSISPGSLKLSWTVDGVVKNAEDNGSGSITGAATGTVDYQNGVVVLHPSALPPEGTVINATQRTAVSATYTEAYSSGQSSGSLLKTVQLPGGLVPNSIAFTLYGVYINIAGASGSGNFDLQVRDNGSGGLVASFDGGSGPAGTVDYTTGLLQLLLNASTFVGRSIATIVWTQTVTGGNRYISGAYTSSALPSGATLTYIQAQFGKYQAGGSQPFTVGYSTNPPVANPISATINNLFVQPLFIAQGHTVQRASFSIGSTRYSAAPDGVLYASVSSTTGVGTPSGAMTPATGICAITSWPDGASSNVTGYSAIQAPPATGEDARNSSSAMIFRTAAAPLRPGSFQLLVTTADGQTVNASANTSGVINNPRVVGRVDHESGVVEVVFINPDPTAVGTADVSDLSISGVTTVNLDMIDAGTLKYNAVSYSYLPLDATILGLDPVRLPSDGRVPIFRPGGFAVVGHTGEISATVSNNQTINCGRVRLSRVRVVGNDGNVINTGYTYDLEAGTVTFTNVTGYSQPVKIQHRIEDMAVVRDAQINGEISFTRALTHAYPLGSYVSSALIAGDLFAQTSTVFDQASWDGTFKDTLVGSAATPTFNTAQYPIAVTNRGAITERWVVRFTNSNAFEVIGEHVGVIAVGNTSTTCAPNNPATGAPYFSIPAMGWGSGWATGNILRFNTTGALFPVWVVRTVQQGPETVTNDNFTLLIRGDVNA